MAGALLDKGYRTLALPSGPVRPIGYQGVKNIGNGKDSGFKTYGLSSKTARVPFTIEPLMMQRVLVIPNLW